MQELLANAVAVYNGQPATTSLKIAEIFGKRHDLVLRTLRTLDAPEDFIARNFAGYTYTAANGKANPTYYITRDGFTLLAMGFTGKAAMGFKVAYIEAFNAMAAQLAAEAPAPALPDADSQTVMRRLDNMAWQIGNLAQAMASRWQIMPNGFVPPTVEDVRAYCAYKGIGNVDAETFCRYYARRNWTQGRNAAPMVSWRMVVREWSERRTRKMLCCGATKTGKAVAK